MIYGETGMGKEMFAQGIHNASLQADGPFLAINCARSPKIYWRDCCFGIERGAYIGAEHRKGVFEQVGGSAEIRVNMRLLSNTNSARPQRGHRAAGKKFYHPVQSEDRKNVKNSSKATLERFNDYRWSGNVRESQHAIENAMNILPDDLSMITPSCIPKHILSDDGDPVLGSVPEFRTTASLNNSIRDAAYQTVRKALWNSGGDISEAARALGMSRQNLQYRIKRY